MWPVIILGLAALVMGCGGGELPKLDSLDDEDGGKDANGTDAAKDVQQDHDGGLDAQVDGADSATDSAIDAYVESGSDSNADAQGDSSADAPLDSANDSSGDAYVDGNAETGTSVSYTCRLLVEGHWGERYAMLMGSSSDVITSGSGFTTDMHFQATSGTPQDLEDARAGNPTQGLDAAPANTWSKIGREVGLATLTGLYELVVGSQGAMHNVTIRGWDTSANSYADAVVFPVTFADVNDNPLPIAQDTSNEFYVEFDQPLTIDVACTAGCATLHGERDISQLADGDYDKITIDCF